VVVRTSCSRWRIITHTHLFLSWWTK